MASLICDVAKAQVETLSNWTEVYNGTALTVQTTNFDIPTSPTNSGKRLLVIAIASARSSASGVGSRVVELSYGGQLFDLAVGDMGANTLQHTALYYLDEAGIVAATNDQLTTRVYNGNSVLTTIWAAVFDEVDQVTPVLFPRNSSSSASLVNNISFAPGIFLEPSELAVKVVCVNAAALRTITGIGMGWEDPQAATTTAANPTRNAVSLREPAIVLMEDAATITLNNTARISMSGVLLNGMRTTTTMVEGPVSAQSIYGDLVAFSATVEPSTVGGFVEFYDGEVLLGTAPLEGAAPRTATLETIALGGSERSITARYVGDAEHRSSVSGPLAHLVHSVQVSGGNLGNGYYPTLSAAIGAVGTLGQAGANVVVTLFDDLSGSAAIVVIPEGDWSSLLIHPSGQVNLSANVNGPLITLDGADRVTIDGVDVDHSAPERLIINNPNTGVQANAIRFLNDATNNTVRNCTLRGASLAVQAVQPGAVVAFWTGITTGNDGNTIERNRIRNADLDPELFTSNNLLPARGIFSSGSGGFSNLALHNSDNVIAENWIFNYFLGHIQETPSRGILIGGGNHQWTIRDNRLFQEEPRYYQLGGNSHFLIDVDGVAGNHDSAGGHLITHNVLGFATGDGVGVHHIDGLASPTGARDNQFRGISIHVANTAPLSSITHNVIDGIYHVTTATGTKSSAPVTLIYVNSGQVDVDSNRIGTLDGMDASISLNMIAVSNTRQFNGIFNHAGVAFRTRGNTVGGIELRNDSFFAIRSMSGTQWECHDNVVGGHGAGLRVHQGSANKSLVAISVRGGTMSASGNVVGNLMLAMFTPHNTGAEVMGIHLRGDGPHVVTGNTVHDLSSTKAGNGGSTTSAVVAGIWSDVAVSAEDNTIQRLAFHGTATGQFSANDIPLNTPVFGIRVEGANAHLTARNNIIDSLYSHFQSAPTVNNVRGFVQGIRVDGVGIQAMVEGNFITRLRVHNGNSVSQTTLTNAHGDAGGLNSALAGINIGPSVQQATIHHNQVYDLENSGTANHRIHATGIRVASTGNNLITQNLVHTIRASRGAGSTAMQSHPTGIWLAGSGSQNTVYNNMVRLGIDADGTPEDLGYRTCGIWSSMAASGGASVRLWHNSVYLGGAGTTATSQTSHALLSINNVTRDHRNNILWNARSFPTSGAGAHYAMELGSPNASLTSDYNCLRATGTNGAAFLVRANGNEYGTLANWQATGMDLSSFIDDPNFVNAKGDLSDVDLHVWFPSPIDATGVLIPEVVEDFDTEVRSLLTPVDIGADALDVSVLPVELLEFTAEAMLDGPKRHVRLLWTTLSESNSDRFMIERSADGVRFQTIGSVQAAGWSMARLDYLYRDERPLSGVSFYRLYQVDLDGSYSFSNTVAVHFRTGGAFQIWPNPVDAIVQISLENAGEEPIVVEVLDATGRVVMERTMLFNAKAAPAALSVQDLLAGTYILRVFDAAGQDMGIARFVKQ